MISLTHNKCYIVTHDLFNFDKVEERFWEGITKDDKKVYILKDRFDLLSNDIKDAFKNLNDLTLLDFHYFTLTPAQRGNYEKVNKAEMDKKISEVRRKENLVQLQASLRPDILKILIPFLSINTKEVIFLTCQHFKEAVGKINLKEICEHAAREGSLEVLKWALKNGASWNKRICEFAAARGHLNVLQWAHANGASWSVRTCSFAVLGGHLNVLQWAHANGAPWDKWVCAHAAGRGRFEVLKWAHANGAPWDKWVCANAAAGGHLELLQWARINGAPWDEDVCERAAKGGHLEVLKWARENGAPWDIGDIRRAAYGKLKILE